MIMRQNIKPKAFLMPGFLCLLVPEYTVPLFTDF